MIRIVSSAVLACLFAAPAAGQAPAWQPVRGTPITLEQGASGTLADLNGDKLQDITIATVDNVTVLLGTGGGFTPARGSPFAAGPGAYFVYVGDVNEDGRPDILSNSFGGNAVGVLLGG